MAELTIRTPRTAADVRSRLEFDRQHREQPIIDLVETALDGDPTDGRWRVALDENMGDRAAANVADVYRSNGFDVALDTERAPGEPAHPPACTTCHGRKEIHRPVTHEEVTCPGCGGSGRRAVKMIRVMYLTLAAEPENGGR